MRMSRLGNTPFIWSLSWNSFLMVWPSESINRTSLFLMPLFKFSDTFSCSECLHWMVKAPPGCFHTTAVFSAYIDNTGCLFISLHSFLKTSWHTQISGTHFERFYTLSVLPWLLRAAQKRQRNGVRFSREAVMLTPTRFTHALTQQEEMHMQVNACSCVMWARRDLSFSCEL